MAASSLPVLENNHGSSVAIKTQSRRNRDAIKRQQGKHVRPICRQQQIDELIKMQSRGHQKASTYVPSAASSKSTSSSPAPAMAPVGSAVAAPAAVAAAAVAAAGGAAAASAGALDVTVEYELNPAPILSICAIEGRCLEGQSEAIRGYQKPSEAIRSHQRPSEAIRGHQRSSESIRSHQRPSEVIRSHQRPSEAIRGHQRSSEPPTPVPDRSREAPHTVSPRRRIRRPSSGAPPRHAVTSR